MTVLYSSRPKWKARSLLGSPNKLAFNSGAAENKKELSQRTDQLIYSIQTGKCNLGTVNSSQNSMFEEGLKFETSQLDLILFYEKTLIFYQSFRLRTENLRH